MQDEELTVCHIVAVRPQNTARLDLTQLGCHAHAVRGARKTAGHEVPDAELPAEHRGVALPLGKPDRRAAGDHEQVLKTGKRRHHVVHHTFGEVAVGVLPGQHAEREHGDGRLVGRGGQGGGRFLQEGVCRGRVPHALENNAVHAHGPGDILDDLLAERLVLEGKLVLDLIVGRTGHADPTGLGQALHPGRDIHPVPVESITLDDHVAEADPDPEFHPARLRQLGVPGPEILLDFDRGLNGVHDAAELGEQIVAGRIYDATVVPLNEIANDSAVTR